MHCNIVVLAYLVLTYRVYAPLQKLVVFIVLVTYLVTVDIAVMQSRVSIICADVYGKPN